MRSARVAGLVALCFFSVGWASIHDAARDGDVAKLEKFIASGSPVDAADSDGWTPLMHAAAAGETEAVRFLLEHEAAVDKAGPAGTTPLHVAVNAAAKESLYGSAGKKSHGGARDYDAVILSLLDHGADATIKARNGYTALSWFETKYADKGARLSTPVLARLRKASGGEAPAPAPTPAAAAAPAPAASALSSDVDRPTERRAARPDDFALVIGVEEYQSLPKADYGVRDAEAVRRHLAALGVPERNIVALEGSQATKSKLESYLQDWLPLNVKPDSTLFVYYSGHGAPDPTSGKAYLVPWDGDPMFLKRTGYPIERLYADLAKTKAMRVVVALDACFSGAGGRSVLAKGARPLVTKIDEGVPAAANLTVLAAASGDQITGTLDGQGHGIFTYYFLKGLSGAAKDAAGAVTAKSLYEYLEPRVEDEARRQNRAQTPTLAGSGATLSAP